METVSAAQTEIIDIITQQQEPGVRWIPVVGSETLGLLDRLDFAADSRSSLLREAVSVLARCIPPEAEDTQDTGLVIGHVQSGKTMSFTTVAALARDNAYQLVIVLSGLTRNLFFQSRDRLEEDLRTNLDRRRWLSYANPKGPDALQSFGAALGARDPAHGQRTVLLTVMKNGSHLDHLTKLLRQLDLRGVPALVIDDEADQASLNTKVRSGGESATYRRICEIRNCLPHHTYLQYTATPQAPLLINLIDSLSPQFAEILTPGSAYTGGKSFFESSFDLIRRIHVSEIPSKGNLPTEPPVSLLDALRVFFLGVAAGHLEGKDSAGANRSMMIHPSVHRSLHAMFCQWVRTVQQLWTGLLSTGQVDPNDPDYQDLLCDFQEAYADLSRTMGNLPPFESLIGQLRSAISQTVVKEVNSRLAQPTDVVWRQHYAYILVGGEVLNRGYTVEGLTVTYMPRSKGAGQADTIQQRARWFGYKQDYLGYCRVYLSDQTLASYKSYVAHEESMRDQLRAFRETGKSLQEWKRAFFLSADLKPTRHMVLDLDYVRGNYADSWFDSAAPHDSEDALAANRSVVEGLIARHRDRFAPDGGHPRRTEDQIHLIVSGLSLREIYEDFLTKLRFTRPGDSANFTGLLLQVDRFLDRYPDDVCTLYQMRSGRPRERSLNSKDEIDNLFQGYYPTGAVSPADRVYPGDREIHAPGELTIQIHLLQLQRERQNVAGNVPAVAVWVPRRMSANWLSQHQV